MIGRRALEVRGWHVLATLLAFFGVIIAVNVAFGVIAVRSFPGEDVPRSYLQGLRYNDTIAERRAQAELGWRASAVLGESARGAVVEVTLIGPDARPLTALRLSGALRRATDARLDRALVFQHIRSGRYVAHIDDLPPGAWRLRARAENEGGALDFESELTWPISH